MKIKPSNSGTPNSNFPCKLKKVAQKTKNRKWREIFAFGHVPIKNGRVKWGRKWPIVYLIFGMIGKARARSKSR